MISIKLTKVEEGIITGALEHWRKAIQSTSSKQSAYYNQIIKLEKKLKDKE